MEILGLVPARGGSKTIPRKNVRDLGGKPLLAHAVEALRRSRAVSRVVVSTDDPEIAGVAVSCGAEVPFLRPGALATDEAPTFPVVRHAVGFLEAEGYRPEWVVLVQPTSPLVRPRTIQTAIDAAMREEHDLLKTVSPVREHPHWMQLTDGVHLRPLIQVRGSLRRQDLPPVYRLNGAVTVFKRSVIDREDLATIPVGYHVMDPEESIDIDSETDWDLAAALLRRRFSTTERIRIGGRDVGDGQPVLVIAEIGVNHNGNLDLARAMIREARACGADAVKFQCFRPEALVLPGVAKAAYQTGSHGDDQLSMLKQLAMKPSSLRILRDDAEREGLVFLSSVFDTESLEGLLELDPPAIKIPSGGITDLDVLRGAGASGRPILLSTGMASMGEIERALEEIEAAGGHERVLLHAVSAYPTPLGEADLVSMRTLRERFGGPVGYSDHTEGVFAAPLAVAAGACVIEKHFTTDRRLPGPDQKLSLDPDGLRELVRAVREAERVLGRGDLSPRGVEEEARVLARKGIVAGRPIGMGKVIGAGDLLARRPGVGVSPMDRDRLVGRRAARALAAGDPIRWEDLR